MRCLTGSWRFLLILLGAWSCAPLRDVDRVSSSRDGVDLDRVIRIFSTATGRELALSEMLAELRGADAVFFGETHVDETTHRLELAVYDGLIAQTGGKVILAMEMFSRDVQDVLDRYLAGEITESEFRENARPWSNYPTGYRPLVERAKIDGLPVVGSNASRALWRKVSAGGREAFEALEGAERNGLAPELHPNSEAYWERFRRVVRAHGEMMLGGGGEDARLYSTQSLWDNTMGYSCAEALARHPGWMVFHLNGAFHTNFHQGTVAQFQTRRPRARVVTLSVVPTHDLPRARLGGRPPIADYVIFVAARSRGIQDGFHAVTVSRDLRYSIHIPEHAAPENPVPLLIWLPQEGLRPADVEAQWRMALPEAALAVIEPPYPQIEGDLRDGGRYFWERTFTEDLAVLRGGLEQICHYLLRYYPLNPDLVTVAGEGAGATAVVAAAVVTQELRARPFALRPARHEKLRQLALPAEPPSAGPLDIFVPSHDRAWWEAEARDYESVGIPISLSKGDASDVAVDENFVRAIRASLGFDAPAPPDATPAGCWLVLRTLSNTSRQWARLYAQALGRTGTRAAVVSLAELVALGERPDRIAERGTPDQIRLLLLAGELKDGELKDGSVRPAAFSARTFRDGALIPIAPGPFGGTTVIVLPAGISDRERAIWNEHESADVLNRHNRFARLRVADEAASPTLAEVLAEIRDSGRSNVLVVPAVFCATATEMQALRAGAGSLAGLNVSWLPGLGGELYRTVREAPDELP